MIVCNGNPTQNGVQIRGGQLQRLRTNLAPHEAPKPQTIPAPQAKAWKHFII